MDEDAAQPRPAPDGSAEGRLSGSRQGRSKAFGLRPDTRLLDAVGDCSASSGRSPGSAVWPTATHSNSSAIATHSISIDLASLWCGKRTECPEDVEGGPSCGTVVVLVVPRPKPALLARRVRRDKHVRMATPRDPTRGSPQQLQPIGASRGLHYLPRQHSRRGLRLSRIHPHPNKPCCRSCCGGRP